MKRAIILGVAALLLAVFVACSKNENSEHTFTFALATEIDDFNPFTNLTADGRQILFNIYEGLVRVKPSFEADVDTQSDEDSANVGGMSGASNANDDVFIPCIATGWEHNEDSTVWTFAIGDVLFHDGSAVTANDVAESLMYARDTHYAGCTMIESVAESNKAVTVRLIAGDVAFVAAMTCPIVKWNGDDMVLGAAGAPIGTGPFVLTQYTAQDSAILTRFDDYHDKAKKDERLSAVCVKFVGSQQALPLALLSGAVDGFVATGDIANEVPDSKSVKYASPSNAVQMLALNNKAAPFRNVQVRRAVQKAIDCEDVIRTASSGYGMRAASPVISALHGTQTVAASSDEAADIDGLTFTITVPAAYTVHVRAAEVIERQLVNVGVNCAINEVDWATWLGEVYMGHHYDATIISVDAQQPTARSFLSRYVSDAGDNFVCFNSNDYDNAFHALQTASDTQAKQYVEQCVHILQNEAASVWIEDIQQVTVYTKHFKGFRAYPLYATDFTAITLSAER